MRTSGRGVFLIKKLMDEVSFYDGGREIKMVKILGESKNKKRKQ
jgi:anti-sigma regulatory factor (Ser/Thr protein kinase)